MKKFKKYTLKIFLTILLTLLFLEIALKIIGLVYQETRKNEFLDNKNNWNKKITILTVGDSHTYGGNVKWNQTYSYILWEKLRHEKKNLQINIINQGKCEYNSSQVLHELDKNLNKYKPNYVIVLTGSSDFWNLIDPNSNLKENLYIKIPHYDDLQIDLSNRIYGDSNDILTKLKIYKFFRIIFLNLNSQNVIKKINKGIINDANVELISSDIFMKMFKSKQYSKVIEYSLNILKALPPDSVYFSHSLSIFYALSIAYQMQSKYTAKYIADELEKISNEEPLKKKSEFMIKYIKYFKEKEKFEIQAKEKLQSNLKAINTLIRKKGAIPIFLTYPSEYKIANDIIRKIAAKTSSYLIDLEKVFKDMNIKSGDSKYFDDDEHMTYHGHTVTANEIFNFLKNKI